MRVNRHIRLATATLAGSFFLSAPAFAADKLFAPDEAFVERVELTKQQKTAIERANAAALVFPFEARPDYGSAEAA